MSKLLFIGFTPSTSNTVRHCPSYPRPAYPSYSYREGPVFVDVPGFLLETVSDALFEVMEGVKDLEADFDWL